MIAANYSGARQNWPFGGERGVIVRMVIVVVLMAILTYKHLIAQ